MVALAAAVTAVVAVAAAAVVTAAVPVVAAAVAAATAAVAVVVMAVAVTATKQFALQCFAIKKAPLGAFFIGENEVDSKPGVRFANR